MRTNTEKNIVFNKILVGKSNWKHFEGRPLLRVHHDLDSMLIRGPIVMQYFALTILKQPRPYHLVEGVAQVARLR